MKAVLLLAALCGPLLAQQPPTVEEARKFIENAEARMMELVEEAGRAEWIKSTYIIEDSEILAAKANERAISATVEFAKQAPRYEKLNLPPDLARKLQLLKLSLTLATPADPAESAELTRIVASMESVYGRGKYCPGGPDTCLSLDQITRMMATDRDAGRLLELWRGWRAISPPMRGDYRRFVELSNKGARELGFADTGAMWRSKYDMPPDDFARELDRLWSQVRPLYVSLHAYVRGKLREKYGEAVPAAGPIPAHLLGNMWAQDWANIYELVAPAGADPGFDLTEILKRQSFDAIKMVRTGERFFASLGLAPLPDTFWTRSLFTKPRDREVVCHASAWNVDNVDDLRLKMCIDITGEDFATVHHELGHNFYQRAYNQQPFLFRDSANDGFHEALGDTISLSVTPEYLVKIGLLDQAPDASKDIGLLLHRALEKVAFLPFGLLIDQWRWKVFTGEITPEQYNRAWWDLRLKYQGVAPPVERTEADFDPGAGRRFYKPEPHPAISIAAGTRTVRDFLEFSQYPWWRASPVAEPRPGTLVEVLDLRFGSPPVPGFAAAVVVDEGGRVVRESAGFGAAAPR